MRVYIRKAFSNTCYRNIQKYICHSIPQLQLPFPSRLVTVRTYAHQFYFRDDDPEDASYARLSLCKNSGSWPIGSMMGRHFFAVVMAVCTSIPVCTFVHSFAFV
jgi:hypothetical protein